MTTVDKKGEKGLVREKLKDMGMTERYTFIGTFERTGFKREYGKGPNWYVDDYDGIYKPTLLLAHVKLKSSGEEITDHLWFNYTKTFNKLGQLKVGDVVQFDARIATYTKGIGDEKEKDYKLERPTKIRMLKKVDGKREKIPSTDNKNALIGYIIGQNREFYQNHGRSYSPYYLNQYEQWKKEENN